jgi:hypothetical protein
VEKARFRTFPDPSDPARDVTDPDPLHAGPQRGTDRGPVLSVRQLLDLYRLLHLSRSTRRRLAEGAIHDRELIASEEDPVQDDTAMVAALALRRGGDAPTDLALHPRWVPGLYFLMGGTPEGFFREALGNTVHEAPGLVRPMTPVRVLVDVGCGLGMVLRQRESDRVIMVFGLSGTWALGGWHEGLNLAAVQGCPMVVVVHRNGEERSRSAARRGTRLDRLTESCDAYGIQGVTVESGEPWAIRRAAGAAVERARSGAGVQLLEVRAREASPLQTLHTLRRYLLSAGLARERDLAELEEVAEARIAQAWTAVASEGVPRGAQALGEVWGGVRLTDPWWRRADGVPADSQVQLREGGAR